MDYECKPRHFLLNRVCFVVVVKIEKYLLSQLLSAKKIASKRRREKCTLNSYVLNCILLL